MLLYRRAALAIKPAKNDKLQHKKVQPTWHCSDTLQADSKRTSANTVRIAFWVLLGHKVAHTTNAVAASLYRSILVPPFLYWLYNICYYLLNSLQSFASRQPCMQLSA